MVTITGDPASRLQRKNKVDSTNRCEALKDKNISDLSDVLYLTSRKFDVTYNRIVLPEILGN